MTGEGHLSFTLGAIIASGGIMGYVRRKSIPSLAAGCVFGTGYVISGVLINRGSEKEGHGLGFALSQLLFLGMGARAIKSKGAVIPSTVAATGFLSSGYYGLKAYEWS